MQHHIICSKTGGLFFLSDFKNTNYQSLLSSSALYKILMNSGPAIKIYIDSSIHSIRTGELLFCKPLNTIQVCNPHNDLKVVAYNKDFYKLSSVEEEVAFYWFWYFGVEHPHSFSLSKMEKGFFEKMYDCMESPFSNSNGCIDTERNILKRIMSVSIDKIKTHHNSPILDDRQLNIIKKFSLLIEEHFQKKASFADISKLLNSKTSSLRGLLQKYLVKQRTSKIVKDKVLEKSHQAAMRIERGIELQYNSRLNPPQKISH